MAATGSGGSKPVASPNPVMSADEVIAYVNEVFPQSAKAVSKWRIDDLTAGEITIVMEVTDDDLRPGGTVSGPAMFNLADMTAYLVILAHIGKVALAVTTALNINFVAKPPLSALRATGRLIKLGRRLAVVEIHVSSTLDDRIVAQATATYSIPPR